MRPLLPPRRTAIIAALLPIVAVHAAYAIAAAQALVPWCVPYLEGCTSISRAARHGDANLFFKATMLPYAALLALFWSQAAQYLARVRPQAARRRRAVFVLGWTGAAFLAVYVVFLGVEGEVYQWLRRYGITFYFAFTVLAQMLTISAARPVLSAGLRRAMTAFIAALLLLGLASIPLQHLLADRDAAVDAIEWSYSLLMTTFYLLVARAWR